jgi:hypothetical protein
MRGGSGGIGRSTWGGRRPGGARLLVREGKAAVAQWRGKGSGPTGVEGEVGRGWAESGAGPKFKKILFEFQLILQFGRTLENCTRRFRRNFNMGIFPKIFKAIQVFLKNEICHAMICNLRQN